MSVGHTQDTEAARLKEARTAARFVGLIIPVGLAATGAALLLVWLPRLPNPMALHWNGAGVADGFGSPWVSIIMFPAVGLLIASLYFVTAIQSIEAIRKKGTPAWGPMNRLVPAIVLGAAVLIFVMEIGTTIPQLDLTDARDMKNINPVMFAAFGAAIVVTFIAHLAQPKLTVEAPVDADAGAPMELSETERAAWFGVSKASKVYVWIISVTIAVTFLSFVWTLSLRPFAWVPVLIMGAVLVFVSLLTVSCSKFIVHVDERGLEARSVVGWPVFRVPASDVERVDVSEVFPMSEFGGWGLRWGGGGAMGIVLRTGEGIRISRKSGKSLTVTLDDAATAASVLMAAAKRSGSTEADTEAGPEAVPETNNESSAS